MATQLSRMSFKPIEYTDKQLLEMEKTLIVLENVQAEC